jgi:hypothetical protein
MIRTNHASLQVPTPIDGIIIPGVLMPRGRQHVSMDISVLKVSRVILTSADGSTLQRNFTSMKGSAPKVNRVALTYTGGPIPKKALKTLTSAHVLTPKNKDRAIQPGLLYRLFWFRFLGRTAVQYSGRRNRIRTYGVPALRFSPFRFFRRMLASLKRSLL